MAKSASEIAQYQRESLKKHWQARPAAKLRPDPTSKKSVLQTLETYHRVFVHNAATPMQAVEMFADGCLDGQEMTVLTVHDHRNHAVLASKPKGLYVVVTSKSPWEITGWFHADDMDDDFHKKGNAWVVRKSDPIWKHPKLLLDDFYRG